MILAPQGPFNTEHEVKDFSFSLWKVYFYYKPELNIAGPLLGPVKHYCQDV